MKDERLILEAVQSGFIVALHYAFQTQDNLYLVTDFCQGGELFFHLRREYKFKEDKARFYAAEIILALECLHE
jgi:serine/threonine protein kinase